MDNDAFSANDVWERVKLTLGACSFSKITNEVELGNVHLPCDEIVFVSSPSYIASSTVTNDEVPDEPPIGIEIGDGGE